MQNPSLLLQTRQALARVEAPPDTGAAPETTIAMSTPEALDLSQSSPDEAATWEDVKSTDAVDCSHDKADAGHGNGVEAAAAEEALALKEACLFDGNVGASGQR